MNVIVGSGYDVDPRSLGYNTCTYIGVRLERGSMYHQVAEELVKMPEVVECHYTTGPYSMLIKVYAQDNRHLMELLNGGLQRERGAVATAVLNVPCRYIHSPSTVLCLEDVEAQYLLAKAYLTR